MTMPDDDIISPTRPRSGHTSRATFGGAEARGPVIDQEGREIPGGPQFQDFQQGFQFEWGTPGANPFGELTREQRLARLDALAKLLDVAFIVPVLVDDTRESTANVPEQFLKAHCTRLPGGEPTPQFVEQVKRLLSGSRSGNTPVALGDW